MYKLEVQPGLALEAICWDPLGFGNEVKRKCALCREVYYQLIDRG